MLKNNNWNKIWKKNTFFSDYNPTINILNFYRHHLINIKKSSKILDCGCGNGKNFIFLKKKGYNIIASDTSKSIINKIRKKYPKYKKKIYLGDIRDLNFKEKSFDAIISEASLYYQSKKDMFETVNKFYELLKPGALLRVYTKSIEDSFFKKFKNKRSVEYKIQKNHWEKNLLLTFLNLKDVKNLFKKFKNVKIGKDEFNFIDYKKKHSFWIITAIK